MPDKRQDTIIAWLKQLYPEQGISLQSASEDASFRRYFRTTINNTSYIVMDAPPEKENIQAFITIAELLVENGSNAPQIIQQNTEQGFLLLGDLGNTQYLQKLNDDTVEQLYGDALDALCGIQICTPDDQLPLYNEEKLTEEMDLFSQWFIAKHAQLTLTQAQQNVLKKTWKTLTNSALEQPQCFVHRDFHSRNLMLTEKNNPGIIDFQDAVKGPITYDLVSLLKDCYIEWPRNKVTKWVENHRKQLLFSDMPVTEEAKFLKWFDLMGLQRHIKVLGIFCRLNARDDKKHYLADLPLTYHYVQETANSYPELADFAQLLTDLKLASYAK